MQALMPTLLSNRHSTGHLLSLSMNPPRRSLSPGSNLFLGKRPPATNLHQRLQSQIIPHLTIRGLNPAQNHVLQSSLHPIPMPIRHRLSTDHPHHHPNPILINIASRVTSPVNLSPGIALLLPRKGTKKPSFNGIPKDKLFL